jgi:3,4-dihydroxy 2-butanone 4-phosphate synthase/GTP cyclohydrolase II
MTDRPTAKPAAFSDIEDAVAAIAAGEMIVVIDDDDRESEGDLIMAADRATPDKVAFMIRNTSGILCTPLVPERARDLRLDPMVSVNDAPLATPFTISVDVHEGLTTGISAQERCNTIRALADPKAKAGDFARPGHVFPLVAKDGGVLVRAGHTEAAVDLMVLADIEPIGLLAELVNDDGTVKHGPQIFDFAQQHELKVISINDLIAYRQSREQLVHRQYSVDVDTRIGPAKAHMYATAHDDASHLAVVFGDIEQNAPVLVRIHRENVLEDLLGKDAPFTPTLQHIKKRGSGVFVLLRDGGFGVKPIEHQEPAKSDGDNSHKATEQRWRTVGIGAQILRDLGISKIDILVKTETRFAGLDGFGISIEGIERLSAKG